MAPFKLSPNIFQFSGSKPIKSIGTGIGNNLKIRCAKSNSAILLTLEHIGKKSLGVVGTIKIAKEIRFLANPL